MSKRCIIAFANETGWYRKGLVRLMASLNNRYSGDVLTFTDEASIGAPPHTENPYAFKVHCFIKALEAGYSKILYLDCSVFAIQKVQPAFDVIDSQGYLMQDSGYFLRDWINDDALKYFGISRDALNGTGMYGEAGMLGLDFSNEKAKTFFDKWYNAMVSGAFKGAWEDHRHDMAAGSMIAWLMHMNYQEKHSLLRCAPASYPVPRSVIFKAEGL